MTPLDYANNIGAIIFAPDHLDDVIAFCGGSYQYRNIAAGPPYGKVIEIQTPDGIKLATPGDVIFKNPSGSFGILPKQLIQKFKCMDVAYLHPIQVPNPLYPSEPFVFRVSMR